MNDVASQEYANFHRFREISGMKGGDQSRNNPGKLGKDQTFPFSSDSVYDSVAHDLVKTRLPESEQK